MKRKFNPDNVISTAEVIVEGPKEVTPTIEATVNNSNSKKKYKRANPTSKQKRNKVTNAARSFYDRKYGLIKKIEHIARTFDAKICLTMEYMVGGMSEPKIKTFYSSNIKNVGAKHIDLSEEMAKLTSHESFDWKDLHFDSANENRKLFNILMQQEFYKKLDVVEKGSWKKYVWDERVKFLCNDLGIEYRPMIQYHNNELINMIKIILRARNLEIRDDVKPWGEAKKVQILSTMNLGKSEMINSLVKDVFAHTKCVITKSLTSEHVKEILDFFSSAKEVKSIQEANEVQPNEIVIVDCSSFEINSLYQLETALSNRRKKMFYRFGGGSIIFVANEDNFDEFRNHGLLQGIEEWPKKND